MSDTINTGELDAFLVQPKNVLLAAITSTISASAIGDILYGVIIVFIYGFSVRVFLLFVLFAITGSLILTSIAIILGSLSFWINKSDFIADTGNNLMTQFATYPDGIFKGVVKVLLYTLIPVGLTVYIPVSVIGKFNTYLFLLVIGVTILLVSLSFLIFYKGLKRYSSSNLMVARA